MPVSAGLSPDRDSARRIAGTGGATAGIDGNSTQPCGRGVRPGPDQPAEDNGFTNSGALPVPISAVT